MSAVEAKDSNTGWQIPIVLLLDALRADDTRELAHFDDEQCAAHRQARELLSTRMSIKCG